MSSSGNHRPSGSRTKPDCPLIVVVISRGEAVRNFLYSDTLKLLSERARVVLLSVVVDDEFRKRFEPYTEEIISIEEHPVPPAAAYVRTLAENAHD